MGRDLPWQQTECGQTAESERAPKATNSGSTILCEIAATIARTPDTYLQALYQRIARPTMAVAHSLLVSIYYMLGDQKPYQELGSDYFDLLQAQHLERHYETWSNDAGSSALLMRKYRLIA